MNKPVTVVGPVSFEHGAPQIRWSVDGSRFLITVDKPRRAARRERFRMIRSFGVAAASLAGLVAILVTVHGPSS